MCPYSHGGNIYKENIELDFSVSVNPLGMPDLAKKAARDALEMASFYPDFDGSALKKAISESEGCRETQIVLGNGVSELFYAICRIKKKGKKLKALSVAPTYSGYEEAVVAAGGSMQYIALDEWKIPKNFRNYITEKTDLVFLCNPNNPTSLSQQRSLILDVAKKCEETKTFLCIDESFLPFLKNENALTVKMEIDHYPHLLVVRSFTKVYGMAGLRMGYLLSANEKTINKIRMQLQPWNTSVIAQEAAIACLQEKGFLHATHKIIDIEKDYLVNALVACNEKAGAKKCLQLIGAESCYVFFRAEKGLAKQLKEKGIMIRDCSNIHGLKKGYYRIGIRQHEDNEKLVEAVRDILWLDQL